MTTAPSTGTGDLEASVAVPTEELLDAADAQTRLRVLIVDDHDVVHWGFRLMLSNQPWVERCISSRSPETKVLLISGAGRISPGAAKAAGASGFIPKDWGAADISRAVRMVGLGMTVFQPQVDVDATPLSPREREVLDLISGGSTNREIAAALHLSPHTIKEHTSSLYRKLGARNRAEAVQRAQRLGLSN